MKRKLIKRSGVLILGLSLFQIILLTGCVAGGGSGTEAIMSNPVFIIIAVIGIVFVWLKAKK